MVVAEVKLQFAEEELAAERVRREHMQSFGRFLSWGLVGPNHEPGVVYTDSCCHVRIVELYEKHGGDKAAAEVAVIAAGIAAHERLVEENR
jgi:hypothetical protein